MKEVESAVQLSKYRLETAEMVIEAVKVFLKS